jgi:hypothetical protein
MVNEGRVSALPTLTDQNLATATSLKLPHQRSVLQRLQSTVF